LGHLLAFSLGRDRDDELQGLDKRRRGGPQRGGLASHHRPFDRYGVSDIVAHEVAQPRLIIRRQASGEKHHGSQRACLAAHGGGAAVTVAPDLRCGECDEQAEYDAEHRQHAGRDALERLCPLLRCERVHHQENSRGEQIGEAEDDQRHGPHR